MSAFCDIRLLITLPYLVDFDILNFHVIKIVNVLRNPYFLTILNIFIH